MSFQLPLDFRLRDEATFDRFYTGSNEELINALKLLVSNPQPQMFYLAGPAGAGKSHLLQAVTRSMDAVMYLPLREIQDVSASVFEGLETMNTLCIDDVDSIAGDASLELALFSLIKQFKDRNGILLMTASALVEDAGFELPDLRSRLNGCLIYSLQLLSDEGKQQFLKEDALHRGLKMGDEVVDWVLTHLPRDMDQLVGLMNQLDVESLRTQRRITIPFIKDLLETDD